MIAEKFADNHTNGGSEKWKQRFCGYVRILTLWH
jgi:hypothetical protein